MQKAIVVGASSGIGRALAQHLSAKGYRLGLAARRTEALRNLRSQLPSASTFRFMDVSQSEEARRSLRALIADLEGVDLIVICAGIGFADNNLPWFKEKQTIDVNVTGFAAMAHEAYQYFVSRGSGHLVGISSVAALRGGAAPAYNASKAFVSNYLQGLRFLVAKQRLDIAITDVKPGFVDTPMAQGEGLFWVATPERAAQQIYTAIARKKKHAYVTKRWRFIGWLLTVLPDVVYHRL